MSPECRYDSRSSRSPVFSVIVPFRDASLFLDELVFTLENQTIEPKKGFEVLFIDDGSIDGGGEQLLSALQRSPIGALLLRLDTPVGPAQARNLGIDQSQGRILTFLDADDLWHPERLQKVLQVHFREGISFSCHVETVMDLSGVERGMTLAASVPSVNTAKYLRRINFLSTSAVSLDANILGTLRFRDTGAEDYDLWLRLSRRREPCIIPETLGICRLNPNGLSQRRWHIFRGHLLSVMADAPYATRRWGPRILGEVLKGVASQALWALRVTC